MILERKKKDHVIVKKNLFESFFPKLFKIYFRHPLLSSRTILISKSWKIFLLKLQIKHWTEGEKTWLLVRNKYLNFNSYAFNFQFIQ